MWGTRPVRNFLVRGPASSPGSPPPSVQRVGLGQPLPHLHSAAASLAQFTPFSFQTVVCVRIPCSYLPQALWLPPSALLGTRDHPASAPAAAV